MAFSQAERISKSEDRIIKEMTDGLVMETLTDFLSLEDTDGCIFEDG